MAQARVLMNRDPRRRCAFIADYVPAPTADNPQPRRTRPGFATGAAAELAVALHGNAADTVAVRRGMCVETAVNYYLMFEQRRQLEAGSIDGYRTILSRLLTAELAEMPVCQLQPIHLNLVLIPRRGEILSAKSKDEYAHCVGRFITALIADGILDTDIAAAFVNEHRTPRRQRLRRLPDADSIAAVRRAAAPQGLAVLELTVGAFARPGEIARLAWADCDFPQRVVWLSAPSVEGLSGRQRRPMPMDEALALALLRWRALSLCTSPTDPVFLAPGGRPLEAADVKELIHAAQVSAGLVAPRKHRNECLCGMPRGRFAPDDFQAAAIIAVARTVTSLKLLAEKAGWSTESLQEYTRYLKAPKRRRPVATLEFAA